MSSESVRVTIFGKDYPLKVDDADAETLKQLAHYVDTMMTEYKKKVAASWDNEKIAVITALNVAGELFETKAKYEAEVKKVQEYEEKIKSFSDMIGSVKALD